ncbi:ABC transporter permease [Nonomuraea terrae]|uniref:ABC transporter permease n=1 Tax=Nonomuraea terrae TaxID=2530383 RepID=UPI001CB75B70|nr:ABC transporter permease [Nonomuraea terrae]
MPSFWIGLLLLQQFSFRWRWFPATGGAGLPGVVLPAVTRALPAAAVVAHVLGQSLRESLREPYIDTARAKGASALRVVVGHALRNAAPPALTMAGLLVGGLLTGSVVAETVFSRQGLGRLSAQAVSAQDLPLVQGIVLFGAAGPGDRALRRGWSRGSCSSARRSSPPPTCWWTCCTRCSTRGCEPTGERPRHARSGAKLGHLGVRGCGRSAIPETHAEGGVLEPVERARRPHADPLAHQHPRQGAAAGPQGALQQGLLDGVALGVAAAELVYPVPLDCVRGRASGAVARPASAPSGVR